MITIADFETYAANKLPFGTRKYVWNGTGEEITLRENCKSFERITLMPRIFKDVSNRDLSTTLLGEKIDFPIAIAPSGMHRLVHPEGETATARAATAVNTGMILSSSASTSFSDVIEVAPNGHMWFQVHPMSDRCMFEKLVRAVEKAGYKGFFLTVDLPVLGIRDSKPFEDPEEYFATCFDHIHEEGKEGARKFAANPDLFYDPSATWEYVDWLCTLTSLPIVLKGIITPDDAKEALNHKVHGILVSNHGARQLDTVLSTIESLPLIVEAVKNSNIEIYLDGGIRRGSDVFKALALGAKAVFVGRPVLWGLTHSGEEGVKKVMNILKQELSVTMALCGCKTISDITRQHVRCEGSVYPKL